MDKTKYKNIRDIYNQVVDNADYVVIYLNKAINSNDDNKGETLQYVNNKVNQLQQYINQIKQLTNQENKKLN